MQGSAEPAGQQPDARQPSTGNPHPIATVSLTPRWVQYSGVTVAARATAEVLADMAEQAQGEELPILDREFVAYHLGLCRADKLAPILAELEAIGFLTVHGGEVDPLTGKRRKCRDRRGIPELDRFSVMLNQPDEYDGPNDLGGLHAQFIKDREAAYRAAAAKGKRARVGRVVIRRGEVPRRDGGNSPETYLYVIGSSDTGRVKIGITTDLIQRLRALQGSSPALLRLLWFAYGSQEIEERLHLRFHSYRTHGEWFDFGKRADPVTAVKAEALRLGAVEVPA